MENFVVSARKYRPATFNTVVGQGHITQTLKNAIARGQLAHAYLFTGPRGVGKTTCARIFAKAINCLNPTEDFEACGTCESCVAFDSGRSFNIHELDAASNNSVDDIRALNEKVRIAPQVGKYSLYIIDEVHMLSTGAFNAFLKTLEEPPRYAIFILATTEKHKILPTILSRCQSYDFKRIRVEDIVIYLRYIASEEGVTSDEESLHLIAQKADGGMRDALSTFDRVVSFCGKDLVYDRVAQSIGSLELNTYFSAIDMALAEDFAGVLLQLDDILSKGFEAGQFLTGLLDHIRNLIVVKNPQTTILLEGSDSMIERYKAQTMVCDIDFLMNAMNLLNAADNSYRTATNRRLHAELAIIKLCGLKKKDSGVAAVYPMPQIIVVKQGEGMDSVAVKNTQTERDCNVAQQTVVTTERTITSQIQNQSLQNQSLQNQIPQSQMPQSQLPQSQMPQSQLPQSQIPQSQMPQSQMPQSQLPQSQIAQDQSPHGQQVQSQSMQNTAHLTQPIQQTIQGQPTQQVAQSQQPPQNTLTQPQSQMQAQIHAPNQARPSVGISSISLSSIGANTEEAKKVDAVEQASYTAVQSISVEQVEQTIRHHFGKIIELWNDRHRPRIATALTDHKVEGAVVTITVPDEGPADEIRQNKLQIERDILKKLGVMATVEVEVKDVPRQYAPVSLDQKLQHLVDLNPNITKLRDELDLTV